MDYTGLKCPVCGKTVYPLTTTLSSVRNAARLIIVPAISKLDIVFFKKSTEHRMHGSPRKSKRNGRRREDLSTLRQEKTPVSRCFATNVVSC